jgi:hypothetical protein
MGPVKKVGIEKPTIETKVPPWSNARILLVGRDDADRQRDQDRRRHRRCRPPRASAAADTAMRSKTRAAGRASGSATTCHQRFGRCGQGQPVRRNSHPPDDQRFDPEESASQRRYWMEAAGHAELSRICSRTSGGIVSGRFAVGSRATASDHEDDETDEDQRRDRQDQSPDDVGEHGCASVGVYVRGSGGRTVGPRERGGPPQLAGPRVQVGDPITRVPCPAMRYQSAMFHSSLSQSDIDAAEAVGMRRHAATVDQRDDRVALNIMSFSSRARRPRSSMSAVRPSPTSASYFRHAEALDVLALPLRFRDAECRTASWPCRPAGRCRRSCWCTSRCRHRTSGTCPGMPGSPPKNTDASMLRSSVSMPSSAHHALISAWCPDGRRWSRSGRGRDSGVPSYSRMPSPSVSTMPASSSSAMAPSMSCVRQASLAVEA